MSRARRALERLPASAATRRRRRLARALGRLGAALAPLCAALACSPAAEPEAPRPNLLLVTLDTTRADRLGCYGYARATSPNLDRFAREATLFTRAYSTSSWTLPAHASLFTGLLPISHGAHFDPEGPLVLGQAVPGDPVAQAIRARGLAPNLRTLAGELSGAGYRSAGIVAGPWLERAFGLDRGFQHWDDAGIDSRGGRSGAEVSERALAFLADAGAHRAAPFFLFLNYFDPHDPYAAPPGAEAALRADDPPALPPLDPEIDPAQSARYDAEIRFMDQQLGRVLDALAEGGLLERTLVVITADHGELLGEHGRYRHGHTLFEPELRVPLLWRAPGRSAAARRDDARIQLSDLPARILTELGVESPLRATRAETFFLAEVDPSEAASRDGHWRVSFDGDYKHHWNSKRRHLLFDLARDPHERTNLARAEKARAKRMRRELKRKLRDLPRPELASEVRPLEPETLRALEQLGYLGADETP